jgi:hypothetical protein
MSYKQLSSLVLVVGVMVLGATAKADGPCGDGQYVQVCNAHGSCGAPAGCHMECEGPSKDDASYQLLPIEQTQIPTYVKILSPDEQTDATEMCL